MFEEIRGHSVAIAGLRAELERRRFAYAYLFFGQDGVGKKRIALEFARGIVCPRATEAGHRDCRCCRNVQSLSHPDVILIVRLEGKQDISIDQIREVQAVIELKALEADHRVLLIDDAHRLSLEAANSLLKTLEEPPEEVVIILITASLAPLPTTVVSRCRLVRFGCLDFGSTAELLRPKVGSPEEAERLARLSEGSVSRALAFQALLGEVSEDEILKAAGELRFGETVGFARMLLEKVESSSAEETRDRAGLLLDLLASVCRDAAAISTGLAPSFWPHRREQIERLAQTPTYALESRIKSILDAKEAIGYNANVGMTLEQTLLRLST